MSQPEIAVVICTHNPRREILALTLDALRKQTFPLTDWELVVVDNASSPPLANSLDLAWHASARIVVETQLGLTPARLCGIAATRAETLVFVDDDNVLAPDFLANAAMQIAAQPDVGVAGGRVRPRFETAAPEWTREFFGNLALCDHGPTSLTSNSWKNAPREYPKFAPVGAGLVVRRRAVEPYVQLVGSDARRRALDRRGDALVSGGDNDLVMTALEAGWRAAYWPELSLEHLIPPARLTRDYLARLNYAIARSWIRVLQLHDACPWSPVAAWTVPLRQARAWFRHQAWRGPAEFVRWRYACGHFAGLAD